LSGGFRSLVDLLSVSVGSLSSEEIGLDCIIEGTIIGVVVTFFLDACDLSVFIIRGYIIVGLFLESGNPSGVSFSLLAELNNCG